MATAPRLGFIGFGEAAFWIARGLRAEGLEATCAFDLHTNTPGRGELIRSRASEAGTTLLSTLAELPAAVDIVLSAVTASQAQLVGEQAAPLLSPDHLFVDINSVSPAAKRAIDTAVTARGGRFAEAAVMSTVPPLGHQVPMLLAGAGAREFADRMAAFKMNLEVLDGPVGSASSVKMFRSVIIKGLEALTLECLLAAEQYGAGERIFNSVSATFPGLDWNQLAHYLTGRTALHAERRVQEMEEVARTLADCGVDPIMASATAQRLKAGIPLKARFAGREPSGYHEVIQAITETNRPPSGAH